MGSKSGSSFVDWICFTGGSLGSFAFGINGFSGWIDLRLAVLSAMTACGASESLGGLEWEISMDCVGTGSGRVDWSHLVVGFLAGFSSTSASCGFDLVAGSSRFTFCGEDGRG